MGFSNATHGLKRPPVAGSSDRHSRAQATATHGLTGAGSWVAFATCSVRRKDTVHTQYLFCAGRDSLSERRRALRLDGSHGRSVAWAEASHGPKRRMGRSVAWAEASLGRSVAWAEASHGPNSALACSLTGTWRASEVLSWTA